LGKIVVRHAFERFVLTMTRFSLAALTALEGGDFEEGVRRMNRVLAVRGHVVPASAAQGCVPVPARSVSAVSAFR